MRRTSALVLLGGLTLAGCQDMGLEYDLLPLEEAMDRPPSDLVAAVMAPTESVDGELIVDGRLWVPWGLPLTLRTGEVRPVGAADGRTVYARAWDQAPYDALFTRLGPRAPTDSLVFGPVEREQWLEFAPVVGRSGRVPSVGPVDADAPPADASGDPPGH